MKRIFNRQPSIALGVQVALAMLAHGKAAAIPHATAHTPKTSEPALNGFKGLRKFLAEQVDTKLDSGKEALQECCETWGCTVAVAQDVIPGSDLSYSEARLWLQSYNAGPYALLKYKGNVPFRETRNYVPRVLKYYQQELSDTPYEPYIVAAAQKYGLDPQMIRAIMKTESDFKKTTVSHAGARGLMQVMPCVWSEVRKRYNLEWSYRSQVFEPQKNIEVACAYLAWLRYDFLPRNFAEFELNPEAPAQVVRDKVRAPKDRIVASARPADGKQVKAAAKNTAPGAVVKTRKAAGRTVVRVRRAGSESRVLADAAAQDAATYQYQDNI